MSVAQIPPFPSWFLYRKALILTAGRLLPSYPSSLKDSIKENDSVLIIDDLIATGGTAEAAAKLVEISKGSVSGFIFVINLFDLGGADKLTKSGYKVENLIDFPGH